MAWRSVIISKPAYLSYKQKSMQITQGEEKFLIPLEDIAVLVIDNQQVTISASLLSACADNRLAVITVNKSHTPNGIFHPYLCHSRALKIMRQQLVMTKPHKKKLWQIIIKQKLLNQALVLDKLNISKTADKLVAYANMVRSGDPDNLEATAAQIYFPAIFGKGFTRADENVFNAALNYGYSILRGAIARSLVIYGFIPAFGLHHCSELNAFNLADDLLEPYRPVVDLFVYQICKDITEMNTELKVALTGLLHHDITRIEQEKITGKSTTLTLIDATVISLSQSVQNKQLCLVLPSLPDDFT